MCPQAARSSFPPMLGKVLVLLATASYIVYRWFQSLKVPYGLFHLPLNKLPNEPDDELPKTEWLNMGYWRGSLNFPGACRALTMKVIDAAKLRTGDSVLDVGFGTGECLILLLSDPAVPRPSKLAGITDISLHCQRTKERLESRELQANLFADDAIWDGVAENHPFHPSSPRLDAILATDCAYHFNTRHKFLGQAFAKLESGGRIALADICFSSTSLSTQVITSIIRLMPLYNRIGIEDYIQQMHDAGFKLVACEDITEQVFPHFIRFLKGRGLTWWLFASVLQVYTSAGARFVVVSGEKPK